MIDLNCREVAVAIGGIVSGLSVRFTGVSIDTRNLNKGNLFVAIKGGRFDGHDFIAQAETAGAAAVIVHKAVKTALPQVLVSDTRTALGRLAAAWRAHFKIPVIGVTGSNGKTTTKEMITAILSQRGEVLATQGNLNNDIGVPLTLCGLGAAHHFAVIEMGANHGGEIAHMACLIRPTIGVVTNAGTAHLEGFLDLEGVAHAKGELFQALDMAGTAVLNADDAFALLWRRLIGTRRTISFGLQPGPDFTLATSDVCMEFSTRLNSIFTMKLPSGCIDIRLPLAGRHNLINACAAAAATWAIGTDSEDIRKGLAHLAVLPGRLQLKIVTPGLQVLDDTYNANPGSVKVALEVLAQAPGEKVLVLGDMGELGPDAKEMHAGLGETARNAGVSRLYTLGDLSRFTAESYGLSSRHFVHQQDLIEVLCNELRVPSTVLVKGSRYMHMEKVVRALTSKAGWVKGR